MRLTKSGVLGAAEYVFFIVAMLLISDALTPILYPPSREELDLGDSNTNRLFLAIVIYLLATALLFPRIRAALTILTRRPEVLLLVLLPLASVLWSADPGPVMRRATAHMLTVLFCLYVVTRYSPEEFFERLLISFWIGMVASILVGLFLPQIGITQGSVNSGAWMGVYGHKAIAGRMCAVSLFVALLYSPRAKWLHVVRISTIICTLALCALTQSRASWLLVLLGGGGALLVQFLRIERLSTGLRIAITATTLTAMVVIGTATFDDLLLSMGRDATMSGRTKLWESAILVAADKHPWFGAGYRDFWLGPAVQDVARYLSSWARMPAHGHNGYLDTWLELGWFGLVVLIFFLVRTIFAVLSASIQQPKSNIWPVFAVCCFIFIVNNISATVALRHTDAAWVLILLASFYTARTRLELDDDRSDAARQANLAQTKKTAPAPATLRPGSPEAVLAMTPHA